MKNRPLARVEYSFIAILFIAFYSWAVAAPRAVGAPPDSVVVPGLRQSVEVLTDRWGVPHVYAAHTAHQGQGE